MGMYDTIVVLDGAPALACPERHALRSFQTKDLAQPSMTTYLVHGGRLYRADNDGHRHEADEVEHWRVEAGKAIREQRYTLQEVLPPQPLRIYGRCDECEPILVRTDRPSAWGDIVSEHTVFVDFRVTFRRGEPVQVERESGTREDLKRELRGRGLFVLEDTEPLAIAHRELARAREALPLRRRS